MKTPESSIAERHGFTLCAHCGEPKEIHMGFNHGQGKCLITTSPLGLGLRFKAEKLPGVMARLKAFYEDIDSLFESVKSLGEGI